MRRLLWIPVLLMFATGGCGRDEAEEAPAAESTPTPTKTPDARAQAKEEIQELTFQWLKAASKEDAGALCDMLAPSEQRYFDKLAGSCEKAWAARGSAKKRAFARRTAEESRPGQIIVYEDGYATIEIHHSRDGNYLTLYAIEEKGEWGMARKKRTGL
jgi:hypothetical protein